MNAPLDGMCFGSPPSLPGLNLILLYPSPGFAFSNVEAAADFEDQRHRFFAEHERFDDYMEMREGLDLCGVPFFREMVVAYKDRKPWYYRPAVFWSASLLLLSWPVRLLQEYNTAHVHYQVGL